MRIRTAGIVLVLATVACGLLAGFFYAYAISVTRGTAAVDDATYVATMQSINLTVRNAWFFAAFFGTIPLTASAFALFVRRGSSAATWLIGAGLALSVAAFLITAGVNVPLNERLAAASGGADLAAVRAAYEGPWNAWNLARTLASTAAFACLTVAALVAGSSSGSGPTGRVGAQAGGGERT